MIGARSVKNGVGFESCFREKVGVVQRPDPDWAILVDPPDLTFPRCSAIVCSPGALCRRRPGKHRGCHGLTC